MPTVLVTGASGFVGRPLCSALARRGYHVKAAMRTVKSGQVCEERIEAIVGDIAYSHADVWRNALIGVDTIIHSAACVHQKDKALDKDVFRLVNTKATSRLCRLAVESGVQRFIFFSTAKVNGETSTSPISEKDTANPQDAYAESKWEAEKHIQRITRGSPTDYVIIRPPLVYGPRVRANFLGLLKVVAANIPLPLGSLHSPRSMIYVANLADAVVAAAENPDAAGQVFMVSDAQDLTVTEMIKAIAVAMGQKPRLFPFPAGWLHGPLRMIGRGEVIEKINRPLTVDASKIRDTLGWRPPFSVQEGLADTVAWFQRHHSQQKTLAPK